MLYELLMGYPLGQTRREVIWPSARFPVLCEHFDALIRRLAHPIHRERPADAREAIQLIDSTYEHLANRIARLRRYGALPNRLW